MNQDDAKGSSTTLSWLKATMWLAALLPLAMFGLAAWYLHQQAINDATASVDQVARVAEEHGLKVFETDIALINRVLDLMRDDSDPVLLAREAELHEALKRMTAKLPQLQGIFLMDANAHLLATNRLFPAPHAIDYSDRETHRHHLANGPQPMVTEVLTSRATGELFFDLSMRRARSDGSFGGVVSTSMVPAYFFDFYRQLTAGDKQLNVALARRDGAVLASWPKAPVTSDSNDGAGMRLAIGPVSPAGAATVPGGAEGYMTTRPLPDYPVTVVAWMTRSAALAPWYSQIAVLAALMFPTALGLVYIAWVALQRTRRSLQVLEKLHTETVHRERVEDALRQAQKLEAMGRLTGGVAHDFNNLLMVISNSLFVQRRRHPGLADSPQLDAIERAVAAGSKLTRQLLSFSRKQPLRPQTITLQQHLPPVFEMLRTAIGSAIQISVAVAPTTAPIDVDAAELELALLNLAINARDAMPGGGRLEILAANAPPGEPPGHQGRFVVLTLRDNGSGIAADVIDRVFEPFFTTKPPGHGTGLGLSQVYGFCNRAGGTASLESRPGEGTTMRLYLPVSTAAGPADARAVPTDSEDLRGLRLLLVEDNDEVAQATHAVLESLGALVRRCENADAAIEVLERGHAAYDVVVSDIVMPGSMNGIEFAVRVRASSPELPVLLMSGYSEFTPDAVALDLEVLPKPSSPAVLSEAIRSLLVRESRVRA